MNEKHDPKILEEHPFAALAVAALAGAVCVGWMARNKNRMVNYFENGRWEDF